MHGMCLLPGRPHLPTATAFVLSSACFLGLAAASAATPSYSTSTSGSCAANQWANVNKKDAVVPKGAAVAGAGEVTANAAGPLGGPLIPYESQRAAWRNETNPLYEGNEPVFGSSLAGGSVRSSGAAAASSNGTAGGRWGPRLWGTSNFPAAQQLSNLLLVALQYFGLGPGVLLCTYLLLFEIRVHVDDLCGLSYSSSGKYIGASTLLPSTRLGHNLVPRLLLFFVVSTGAIIIHAC